MYMLYTDKSYICNVSSLMANVLLLFNNNEKLTFKDIIENLAEEITEDLKDELEAHILGLCNPRKALILKKDFENKPTLALNEFLTVNKEFSHK